MNTQYSCSHYTIISSSINRDLEWNTLTLPQTWSQPSDSTRLHTENKDITSLSYRVCYPILASSHVPQFSWVSYLLSYNNPLLTLIHGRLISVLSWWSSWADFVEEDPSSLCSYKMLIPMKSVKTQLFSVLCCSTVMKRHWLELLMFPFFSVCINPVHTWECRDSSVDPRVQPTTALLLRLLDDCSSGPVLSDGRGWR